MIRVGVGSAVALMLLISACSSGMLTPDGASPSPDGASSGMCGADVPAGQACNTLANVADAITPTCASGTLPVGTGGTIVDGTYVLTSQTYYQDTTSCSKAPLSETITIAGDCIQVVFGGILSGTFSGTVTAQGNTFMSTRTCAHIDVDGSVIEDAQAQTYTATATTFTLFSTHPSLNASNVGVFTRR